MLRLNFKSILLSMIALVLVSSTAFAQGPRSGMGNKDRLHKMKCDKMIVFLDLDKEKDKVFLDNHEKFRQEMELQIDEINLAAKKLHYAVENESKDLKDKIANVEKLHAELQDMQANMKKLAKSDLSEIQYAKFLIFEHKFRKEIRRSLMNRKAGDGMNNNKKKKGRR